MTIASDHEGLTILLKMSYNAHSCVDIYENYFLVFVLIKTHKYPHGFNCGFSIPQKSYLNECCFMPPLCTLFIWSKQAQETMR